MKKKKYICWIYSLTEFVILSNKKLHMSKGCENGCVVGVGFYFGNCWFKFT